jgi:hypothetical protein
MADPSIPTVLALLLCDQVITDATSGKKTLVGLFDSMHPPNVPFPAPPFCIYARLSDAEGKYNFRVDIVHLEQDQKLGGVQVGEATAPDRLRFVDLVMQMPPGLPLTYGTYEFQLFANDVFIGRAIMLVQPPAKK